MRLEWDRRIEHDYRYWMSDGVESDRLMWETGVRDFGILSAGLDASNSKTQVALELGCGVGRLLRAASSVFGKVVGIDVSESAVRHARQFVQDLPHIDVHLGNGINLEGIHSSSIDFAYSFAALSSMPVAVIASYLHDLSRVMKFDGRVSLQVYLGKEQDTLQQDTIAIRSFEQERFMKALTLAGFSIDALRELVLPFEISDHAAGLTASVVYMTKKNAVRGTVEELLQTLCRAGEKSAAPSWEGSQTEYLMALARASQHLNAGRKVEASRALEYAVTHFNRPEPEVLQQLELLRKEIGPQERSVAMSSEGKHSYLELNMEVLRQRFPEAFHALLSSSPSQVSIEYGLTGEPVVCFKGLCLDQKDKPVRASEVWVERTVGSSAIQKAQDIVAGGIGSGYHLRALLGTLGTKRLHLIEPKPEILKAAFSIADYRDVIRGLTTLSLTVQQFEQAVQAQMNPNHVEFVIHPQSQVISGDLLDEFRRSYWSMRGLDELRPNIAVVGPMYGGSLPIAGYVTNALKQLGQRVYPIDVSEFYSPFKGVTKHVRDKGRIDTLEANYIELLSQMVLETVLEKKIDMLVCLAQAPVSGRVLEEMRKKGIVTVMWFVEDCGRFSAWQHISRYYDYMFLIQRDTYLEKVKQAGAGRAIYLPVACDPSVHSPVDLAAEEKQRWGSLLSFLGAGYNNRLHVFATLAQHDFKIWGTEWPNCPPFDRLVQEQGRRISPAEYNKIFNASTINLNLHSSSERDGVDSTGDFINPRTFELAAAGAFQLVDKRSLLGECFDLDSEIATFSTVDEMHERIRYYVAHPEERQEIITASKNRVLRDHTYVQRMKTLLSSVYADKYEAFSAKVRQGPWTSALTRAQQFPELHTRLEKVFERGGEPSLNELVSDITQAKGSLSDTELKLLFLHHIKTQVTHVTKLRNGS